MLEPRRRRRRRLCANLAGMLAAAGFAGLAAAAPAAGAEPEPDAYRAVVDRYCLSCHNSRTRTAGLALDTVAGAALADHTEVWEKVVRKLRARQMPPVPARRPDEPTYAAAIGSLEAALDRHAAAAPDPGRSETFRRLNRTEYHNAVRDLLALDVDVASLLPSDSSSFGFDNITVGNLSPTLLERYVGAAEKIARLDSDASALGENPHRGTRRDEILPGLRAIPSAGQGVIAFDVDDEARVVRILSVTWAGADWMGRVAARAGSTT